MPPLFTTGLFNLSTNSAIASSSRPNMSPYVTISLTTTDYDRRVITLHPNQTVHIGRASRSETKNLAPADDNALFDCPVVSRLHAELHVSSWAARHEQVTIKDLTSLHGTTVNGERIEAQHKFTLKSGDVIKLGDRVTRGDATHDGLSLTFRRLDDTDMSTDHHHPHSTFQVPSPSEPEASDYESDMESVHSFAKNESSANTTPENNKIKLGTQNQPIFINDSVPAPVIDLSQDEQEKETHFPKRVVPDTYAEDNESLVAEEDDVDEGAYVASDDESGDMGSDHRSDDEAFDESIPFDDDASADNDEDEDLAPVDDIDDEDADRLSNGDVSDFVAPAFATTFNAPTSVNNVAAPASLDGPKPRYDPVRNSQAPVEAASAKPTYIPVKPGKLYKSRWDLRPPQGPAFRGIYQQEGDYLKKQTDVYKQQNDIFKQQNDIFNYMPPAPPAPSLFDHYLNTPSFAPMMDPMPVNNWNTAPHQPLAPLASPGAVSAQPDMPAADTSMATTASKISIPSIIETDGVIPSATTQAVQPQELSSPVGNKRKADEMGADAEEVVEASQPPAKQQKAETTTDATTPRSKRRRSRRQGTVRKLATSVAQYGTAAVCGAAATMVFLSSPAAQWLIEYLN